MTASDDYWPERPGPDGDRPGPAASGDAPSASPSRSDFPVRRTAAAASRGSALRDEALVGGRARFRSDRNRSWAARRDLLPGGRPAPDGTTGDPDLPPPLPTDLRVDRLEVLHDSPSPTRPGWPAAPQPPSMIAPSPTTAQPPPAAAPPAPAARRMPPSVGRGDGSISRADLADLLPRQGQHPDPAPPAAPAGSPGSARPSGRRAAGGRRPDGSAAPLDDLMPHPEQRAYGVDLPTSADELFPPSTRRVPPDLLSRKPAGTSTGLQPRIFAPGTGTDESSLPVLVGDPVADGGRRFDLTAPPVDRVAAPARPDPRLPVRPAPPAELGVTRAWGAAPPPAGTVGPPTGPLGLTAPPPLPTAPPTLQPTLQPTFQPTLQPTGQPAPSPGTRAPAGPGAMHDVSDLAALFGPRPAEDGTVHAGYGPTRPGHAPGHARRQVAEPGTRRGWAVPTVTAALGLVAGIVFASSSEPAAVPSPARTVVKTVTVAPTP